MSCSLAIEADNNGKGLVELPRLLLSDTHTVVRGRQSQHGSAGLTDFGHFLPWYIAISTEFTMIWERIDLSQLMSRLAPAVTLKC